MASVLVVVASKHGATTGIADALAKGLVDRGLRARVASPESIETVEGHDAVVLGSAVYAGHWLAPAKAFVLLHADALRERPVWLFSSGPIGPPGAAKPEGDPADIAELEQLTGSRGHQVFAGALERERLGRMERAVVRTLRAPLGDFRDWDAVDAFAGHIAEVLTAEVAR